MPLHGARMCSKRQRARCVVFCRKRALVVDERDLAVNDNVLLLWQVNHKVGKQSLPVLSFEGLLRLEVFTSP